MVMGEQVSEGRWEHTINVPNVPPEDPIYFVTQGRHFVTPRIVVEVEYEDCPKEEVTLLEHTSIKQQSEHREDERRPNLVTEYIRKFWLLVG